MGPLLPPHLVSLVPSEWAIWRWFVLRGTGFPANLVDRLSAPAAASAADASNSADNNLKDEFQIAIQAFDAELNRLRASGKNREDPYFKVVLNARRRLVSGKVPAFTDLEPELCQKLLAVGHALQKTHDLRIEFENRFAGCMEAQSKALIGFACDPLFQEAVIWQNRHAFETAIQPLAASGKTSDRDQRQRRREELVGNYVQRYSVKNDTIGFFGPVAWGILEAGDRPVTMISGDGLLKRRNTYFEDWAIDKFAETLSSSERYQGVQWWIPPRLVPLVFIEDGMLHQPGAEPQQLSPLEAAALPLCDGGALPEEILSALRHQDGFSQLEPDDLTALLKTKVAEGILLWRFLAPVEVNSEKGLRLQLLRIGNEALRKHALDDLDRLNALRGQVAASAGNPTALLAALQDLESGFTSTTQVAGHRNQGLTYGGRTIVYEDCQRDVTIKMAPQLLEPAVPVLSLLLRGLRWLVHSLAQEFDRFFVQSYDEFAEASGKSEVPVMDWWLYTQDRLADAQGPVEVERLFKSKWAELLPLDGQSPVQFESRALRERVEKAFPDIAVACPVRYYCPDLMLAATPEGVQRGDCLYVLGEIHLGKNSLTHASLVEQHPDRDALRGAPQWDFPSGRLKLVDSPESGPTTVRTAEGLFLPTDYLLATTPSSVAPTGYKGHPFSGLLVRKEDGEIVLVDRKQSHRFHILDAFADLFCAMIMNKAGWSQPRYYSPRVLIDKLVIQRETWRAPASELGFAHEKEERLRFLGARKWMKSRGLPRRLFVKSPTEMKPFYLDLDSPVLVEILCRSIRKVEKSPQAASAEGEASFSFSEMLPDPDQTWLQDASGARYTSELRFAIVDLEARARSLPKTFST